MSGMVGVVCDNIKEGDRWPCPYPPLGYKSHIDTKSELQRQVDALEAQVDVLKAQIVELIRLIEGFQKGEFDLSAWAKLKLEEDSVADDH